jgi:hypothetical protein
VNLSVKAFDTVKAPVAKKKKPRPVKKKKEEEIDKKEKGNTKNSCISVIISCMHLITHNYWIVCMHDR